MITEQTYAIGEPVNDVPPRELNANTRHPGWYDVYVVAQKASGAWVPVEFTNRSDAKRLGAAAQKHPLFEAEVRRNVCYLRMVAR